MEALLTAAGIVLFFLGLLFSFAWHELGHLAAAKMFGVRCTQYMVGFGKTLWSRTRSGTEYGIKAVPLGGYVRMVGMVLPPRAAADTTAAPMSRWRALAEDARAASMVDEIPGDERRRLYDRAPWKKIVVMGAGPVMNLALAVALLSTVLMGFGEPRLTTVVGTVGECVVPATRSTESCPEGAPPTPAAEAGVRVGDRITAVAGTPTPTWDAAQGAIQRSLGPTPIEVDRGGRSLVLRADLIENEVVVTDEDGMPVPRTGPDGEPLTDGAGNLLPRTETAGFLGVEPSVERVPLGPGETAERLGGIAADVGTHLVLLPTRIPDLFGAAFLGQERADDSPVGVVGASRIGGEVLSLDVPVVDRAAVMLSLLAAVNMFLFAFNLVPILPLDGGHVFGAMWEAVRRRVARLRGRADPGPFDVARMMPAAYIVVAIFVGLSVLLLVADVVNPVRLIG